MPSLRPFAALAARLALHPVRLARMLRAGWTFRARGWYRRPPFLPLPPAEYLEWRLHTAYRDAREPSPEEAERYLDWVVRMRPRSGARPGR